MHSRHALHAVARPSLLCLALGLSLTLAACGGRPSELPGTKTRSSAASLQQGTPIVGLGGKCVDVDRADPTAGNKVQLWDCNGTSAQGWTFQNGALVGVGGKCLDVPGGNTANGTLLQIWDCNGSSAQQWQVQGQTLVGVGGKCLDLPAFNTTSGTRLEIWDCNGGTNQQWSLSSAPPPPPPPGPSPQGISPLVGKQTGLCVDTPGSSFDQGLAVGQYSCTGNLNQDLQFNQGSDGFYTLGLVHSGDCLDASGGGALQNRCSGSDSQRWTVTSEGNGYYHLATKTDGSCLSTRTGGPLQTAACDGSDSQSFLLVGFLAPIGPAQAALGVAPETVSQDQHESAVKSFEAWLGRPVDFAVDFLGDNSWSDLVGDTSWVTPIWHGANPNRRLMWSVPLSTGNHCTGCGTSLADVASGLHDGDYDQVAAAIAANQPNALIRIGWEFNGGWYSWGAKDHQQDYIQAFRRVVGIFRNHSSQFQFVWCTNLGQMDFPPDQAYPGDDVVDIVGMDVYDSNYSNQDPPTRWNFFVHEPYGLNWHANFARLHGKLAAFPEWGAGGAGDNPYFITQMAQWISDHRFAYQSYWESNSAYTSELELGQFPQEASAYKQAY